ncbi:MAG: DUF669 domain-containing protein [Phycisphaerales bacterium]|nr:DUF669 domain-containing protein [Phycisphaerales bacterium]
MAHLDGFDAHDVDPNVGFDPIPIGKYLAIITASEMKPTKAGTGEYLELELEVIEGPYKGRKLWDRLTLKHPNETTVQIAKGTLSSICRSVNVMKPRDSVELHNLPLIASVGCKKREDNGELTNYIKGYAKRDASPARPTAAAANGAGGTPPWKR